MLELRAKRDAEGARRLEAGAGVERARLKSVVHHLVEGIVYPRPRAETAIEGQPGAKREQIIRMAAAGAITRAWD